MNLTKNLRKYLRRRFRVNRYVSGNNPAAVKYSFMSLIKCKHYLKLVHPNYSNSEIKILKKERK